MPITEECTVIKKEKNLTYIKLVKSSKCDGCKACGFGKKNTLVLPALCEIDCNSGDRVMVTMPEKTITGAPIITYVIPLLFFLGGLLAVIPLGEGFMLLFGLIALAISFVPIYFIDRHYKKSAKYLPIITGKIGAESIQILNNDENNTENI